MKIYFYTALLLLGSNIVIAQSSQDSITQKYIIQSYHDKPLWIEMMEDPNANYYVACKAFYVYWQGREIPAESEGETKKLDDKEHEDLGFKDPASYAMIYQYKRFKNWEKTVINRIDPQTGRILSDEELKIVWQEQTKGTTTHIE